MIPLRIANRQSNKKKKKNKQLEVINLRKNRLKMI